MQHLLDLIDPQGTIQNLLLMRLTGFIFVPPASPPPFFLLLSWVYLKQKFHIWNFMKVFESEICLRIVYLYVYGNGVYEMANMSHDG